MNQWAWVAICAALSVAACKKSGSPVTADASSPTASVHTPKMGGTTVTWRGGTAELVVGDHGAMALYLRDERGSPVSLKGAQGVIKVALPNFKDHPLKLQGDHFAAEGLVLPADRPTLVAVLTLPGQNPEVLRFGAQTASHTHPQTGSSREAGLDELTVRVTDSTCLLRGEAPAEAHRECAIRCIHGGAAIALVDKESNQIFVAIAAPGQSVKDLLLPYIGAEVLVRGRKRVQGGSQFFEVREVYGSHGHESQHGGAVGMAGNLHLEILALTTGEVRLYLSDDFRRPVSHQGVAGTLEARLTDGALQSTPFAVETNDRYLTAKLTKLEKTPTEITARLRMGDLAKTYGVPNAEHEDFFMTFIVDPQEEASAPGTREAPLPKEATLGKDGVHEVRITVQGGYSPSEVELKKGVRTRLIFDRKDDSECSRELVIPGLKVRQELRPLGTTTVEVTPDKTGALPFRCGMGMLKGTLTVK
jgi:hypothetical protein